MTCFFLHQSALHLRSGKFILPLYREFQGSIEDEDSQDEVSLTRIV